MATETSTPTKPPETDECVPGASVADVLRLLSGGATGAILMALGEGPLRTKGLTERVPGYAPRTIYRYAGKLAELEVVDREEEPGVPSKVVHTLTDPCGSELYELVNRFATASLTRLPDGRIDAHSWASLGLLADLWEAGMVEELACGPKTPTELARGPHGLSYHQVNRRAGLFKTAGFICEQEGTARRRFYALTEKARRAMGLVAGIGRWRHHHVVAKDEEGMTRDEMATVLKAALPLVRVPQHVGKCLRIQVLGDGEGGGAEGESVWAEVEEDGGLHSCASATPRVDGWGRGKVEVWIPTVLDGESRRVLVGGDEQLVSDCLGGLHDVLWTPAAV
ncbi:MAG: winged helix-turn-helix transcriptional regulator [Solirubrobacterales bacterium]